MCFYIGKKGDADERNYGLIAELYQQLKKNYDDRRDYWTAGDFHYGEMEMKRLWSRSPDRRARWLHANLGLVARYKYASEYGESYLRPFLWLAIVLLVFTLLYPVAGLELKTERPNGPAAPTWIAGAGSAAGIGQPYAPAPTPSELSYEHFFQFAYAHPKGAWFGGVAFFGHSLMRSPNVAAFQKDLEYRPTYPGGA